LAISKNTHSIEFELERFKQNLFDLSANNPFINVSLNQLAILDDENQVTKIYKKQIFYQKEFGLSTALRVKCFLKWKDPTKTKFFISPLFYETVQIVKKRKLEFQFEVEATDDYVYSNPILVHALKQNFDIHLPLVIEDENSTIELISKQLDTDSARIGLVDEFDDSEQWQIIKTIRLGNFNYKKSTLAQDYDSISADISPSILHIMGSQHLESQSEAIGPIIEMDSSQEKALELATTNDMVLQGPPGTGKSQSIVNLIGHFMSKNKRVLFVSQKRSALDVVYDKLDELNLKSSVAYFNAESDEKKKFYKVLRDSWESLSGFKESETSDQKDFDTSLVRFYEEDYLIKKEESLSSSELVNQLLMTGLKKKNLGFEGTCPRLSEWNSTYANLHEVDKKAQQIFGEKPLGEQVFLNLNRSLAHENEPTIVLEKRIAEFNEVIGYFNDIINQFKLNDSVPEITRMAVASSILNMVNKSQLEILNSDSKAYKSFSNWAKKYELAKSKYARQKQLNSKWKHKPLKSEITELIDLVKHQHAPKGIFGILKRRSERLDKAFEGFDPLISKVGKVQLLEELRTEWNLQGELREIELKLKHNFEINNPEVEIALVFQLRNKLDKVNQTDYVKILEHSDSIGLIEKLAAAHSKIQSANHLLKFTFDSVEIESLNSFSEKISFLERNLKNFNLFQHDLKKFFKSEKSTIDFIRSNPSQSLISLNANVLYNELLVQNKFESRFDDINAQNLLSALNNESQNRSQIALRNIDEINEMVNLSFKEKEVLLATPSAKLKGNDKELKKLLKVQKRTMMHEIAKKQRHLSIKQFTNECWDYLKVFQKVWVMNPLSVSQRLPLTKELFDVVIFDESSQIPIEDAIPAIYRAKQVVVVGDDMQMPPSKFFSTAKESLTLLDQAQLHFNKEMFKWHYRSLSPELIQFSNWRFYDDNLMTFPAANSGSAISFIKIDGVFENGCNELEAEAIVEYLSEAKGLAEIGVIAFSLDQEKLIRSKLLKKNISDELLLIRNLENVQGIERDEIIISIGYGKNPEGKFRMNFGPVNQESGPNRLNVMFSRARKKMTVFSSVSSQDFGVSENQGVNCLKDFIGYCEQKSQVKTVSAQFPKQFSFLNPEEMHLKFVGIEDGSPFNAIIQEKSNRILLIDPSLGINESKDLATIYNVLSQRFKKLEIALSIDLWNNPDSFKNDILTFFN
jgi:AAA domain